MGASRTVRGSAAAAAIAGAGAAGVLALRRAFRSDLRAARDRLTTASRVVDTSSGPIEVAEVGSGPPVLVVHGASGGFDMGLHVGSDVLGDGYRIIAPSRFGYLRTPMPTDASHASQADAFAALLDALAVPSAVVVAVSAGAQSATQLALHHPHRVTALVLITPALYFPPGPGGPEPGPPAFVIEHLLASDFLGWALVRFAPNLLVRLAGVPGSLTGQVPPELRRQVGEWFFPTAPRHRGLAHDLRTTTPVAPDLPIEELRVPLLLVSAADDPYRTADVVRYTGLRLPTANVVVLPSGGHVLLGQGERVRQIVRAFLSAVG